MRNEVFINIFYICYNELFSCWENDTTSPPTPYKVLVELLIRASSSTSMHSPTYINTIGVHASTHIAHRKMAESISKAGQNPHLWYTNWFNGGYVTQAGLIRVFSKLIHRCGKSLPLGSWDFWLRDEKCHLSCYIKMGCVRNEFNNRRQ